MTALPDRRGFLRGLVSLPLIGGGVTLIGKPTAAAVTVTAALQERYLASLAHEHFAAVREHAFRASVRSWKPHPDNYEPTAIAYAERCRREGQGQYYSWLPDAPDIESMVAASEPSTRAAVVLSAVGCSLGGLGS